MDYSAAARRRLSSHVYHGEELPYKGPRPWSPPVEKPYRPSMQANPTIAPQQLAISRPTAAPEPRPDFYRAGTRVQTSAPRQFGFTTDASTPPGVMVLPAENDPMANPFPELQRILQMLGLA